MQTRTRLPARKTPAPRTRTRPGRSTRAEKAVDGVTMIVAALLETLGRALRARPARSLLEFVGRLATWTITIAAVIGVAGGRGGLAVSQRLVELLILLTLVAAVDQWIAVPLLRGLGSVGRGVAGWAARRRRKP